MSALCLREVWVYSLAPSICLAPLGAVEKAIRVKGRAGGAGGAEGSEPTTIATLTEGLGSAWGAKCLVGVRPQHAALVLLGGGWQCLLLTNSLER